MVIQEQQLFAAREVAKADARPGGYVAAGGHGGIVGNISHTGRIALTYLPVFKHTYLSDLKITTLPNAVKAARPSKWWCSPSSFFVQLLPKRPGGCTLIMPNTNFIRVKTKQLWGVWISSGRQRHHEMPV